ncbi:hypothetical protein NDU88_005170 [Pleurodeles waltl]|uniref:Secreted protein n=1 Tax=Pleurodeles waltl TaxID=8319 RepID=A0AAV7RLK4_PLEWA|nr:hypothetical protein NDU88_005170 [Pleurodeles waltl]
MRVYRARSPPGSASHLVLLAGLLSQQASSAAGPQPRPMARGSTLPRSSCSRPPVPSSERRGPVCSPARGHHQFPLSAGNQCRSAPGGSLRPVCGLYGAPGQKGVHLVFPTAAGPTPLLKRTGAELAARRTAPSLMSPAPAKRQAVGPRASRHVTDALGRV